MARLSSTLGALLMGCLVLLIIQQLVLAQTQAPKSDELKFNGNSGDEQQQQQDTTIIDNNSRPFNGAQQQEQQQQQQQQQQSNKLEGNFYEDSNAPRPGPLPWPFTPNFGFGAGPPPQRGQSLLHQLMGGPSRLFEHLDRPMRQMEHMSRNLDQQFRDLERQATTGEGQDVSYFQRNGVAYVRTCTTKRVMPGGQTDQKQLGPASPSGPLDRQQSQLEDNQQQNRTQDTSSSELTSVPSYSQATTD